MELLFPLVIVVVAYVLVKSLLGSGKNFKVRKSSNGKDLSWLDERWKLAEKTPSSGEDQIFPEWWFKEVTDHQIEKLDELEVSVKGKKLTRGQASDLIGLHYPPDEDDLSVLKFFKVPTRGYTQTQARHQVAMLFSNPDKVTEWENRPPTQLEREFFKFFNLKIPKGTTHKTASQLIAQHQKVVEESNEELLDEWSAYVEILEEVSDPEFRESYEIKKPSLTVIRQAIEELKKNGLTYRGIADDIDLLVDKMLELKPGLERV